MIGDLVRELREGRGLTQTELANLAGLRQTYISQVESGEIAVPRDHNLDKLGKALGLTRADFYRAAGMLDGMEQPPPHPPANGEEHDRRFDPEAIVAWVESKPDPTHQADLARERSRRTRESYVGLCLRLNRAWTSNSDLVFRSLAEVQ